MKTFVFPESPIGTHPSGLHSYKQYAIKPGDIWIFGELKDLYNDGIYEMGSGINGIPGPMLMRATLIRDGNTSKTWFPLTVLLSHTSPIAHGLIKRSRRKHGITDVRQIINMIAGKTLTIPKRAFTLK